MRHPRTSDYPPALQPDSNLLSDYGQQSRSVATLDTIMSHYMAPVARHLVQQPIGPVHHGASTFEFYHFTGDPWAEASVLARVVAREHPELSEPCGLICDLRPSS